MIALIIWIAIILTICISVLGAGWVLIGIIAMIVGPYLIIRYGNY